MTNNENDELIKNLQRLASGPYNQDFDFFYKVIHALESQPFDVLQWLRDGGKIMNEHGDVLNFDGGSFNHFELLLNSAWQPYDDSPAEGSREWAMEQNCRVTHETWIKDAWINFLTKEQYFGGSTYSTAYDTGWSLYVETREPGWYSGIFVTGDKVDVYKWTRKGWMICGVLMESVTDDTFNWISSTRIELESPDEPQDVQTIPITTGVSGSFNDSWHPS